MEIFSAIPAELALLRGAFFMGAGLFVLYDCLRVFRRIVPHGIFWISLEDALYWIAAAGWFFLRLCRDNNGIIRFYVLFAMAVGALLYYVLLGRPAMKYISLLLLTIKKQLKKVKKAITIELEKRGKHEDEV
ncbi:MAG: spore cortex biosynthesis protein YabQ [Blautia sp.]|nr:spore cortex biosynthesis protein YabQ [Blautia sp.]